MSSTNISVYIGNIYKTYAQVQWHLFVVSNDYVTQPCGSAYWWTFENVTGSAPLNKND